MCQFWIWGLLTVKRHEEDSFEAVAEQKKSGINKHITNESSFGPNDLQLVTDYTLGDVQL